MKFSKWASLATARSRLKSSMAEESGAICFQHSTPTSRAWSQMKPNVLTSGLSKFQRAQAPSSRARSQMNSTELTSSLGTIRRAQAQSLRARRQMNSTELTYSLRTFRRARFDMKRREIARMRTFMNRL
ncbi:hypothetical protein ISCGN_005065 [Ixodes scapularis]